jgi:hypothetical protein
MRSERLVLRIHSDLMYALTTRAKERGVTRSMYIEKILIAYMNEVERAGLDGLGRHRGDLEMPAFMGGGVSPLAAFNQHVRAIQYPPKKNAPE